MTTVTIDDELAKRRRHPGQAALYARRGRRNGLGTSTATRTSPILRMTN